MEEMTATVKDIALALIVPGDAVLARAKQESWPVGQGEGAGAIFNVADLPEDIRPFVIKRLLKVRRQRPVGDEHTVQQLADFFGRSRGWVEARAKGEEWPFEMRNGRKIFKLSAIPKEPERKVKKKVTRTGVKKSPPPDVRSNIIQCFENIERIVNEASQEVSCILEALNCGSEGTKYRLAAVRNRSTRHFFLCQRRMKNIRRLGVVE